MNIESAPTTVSSIRQMNYIQVLIIILYMRKIPNIQIEAVKCVKKQLK